MGRLQILGTLNRPPAKDRDKQGNNRQDGIGNTWKDVFSTYHSTKTMVKKMFMQPSNSGNTENQVRYRQNRKQHKRMWQSDAIIPSKMVYR
jgi:hypothetical protein